MPGSRSARLCLPICALLLCGARVEAEGDPSPGWEWPADLSDAQRAELRPLRDRYQARLAALGPSAADRLAAIAVDSATRAEIRKAIHEFSYRQLRGSADAVRERRRAAVLARYGLRAIPFLCEALEGDRYWSARVSVEALRILAAGEQGEDARWLAFHFGAPAALLAMFGAGPEVEWLGLQRELDAALRALLPEADVEVPLAGPMGVEDAWQAGRRARRAWAQVWREVHTQWLAREHAQALERRELERKLDLLRLGMKP